METLLSLTYRAFNRGRTPEQKRRQEEALGYAQEKARVIAQRPSLLPEPRKKLSQTSRSDHPQPLSPLFTILPSEIRQRVFFYVLGGNTFHLAHIAKRIVHQRFDNAAPSSDEEDPTGKMPLQMPPLIEWIDESNRIPHPGQFSSLTISLLQTCRAIYIEAIPILYKSNTFSVNSPLVLLYLHDYALLPQRFSEIRHLHLIPWVYFDNPAHDVGRIHEPYDPETWPRFWDLAANMGLRSLGLWVEKWGGNEEDCTVDADWIQPLLKVKGVGRVGIHLQLRVTIYDVRRLHVLEEEIEKQWTKK